MGRRTMFDGIHTFKRIEKAQQHPNPVQNDRSGVQWILRLSDVILLFSGSRTALRFLQVALDQKWRKARTPACTRACAEAASVIFASDLYP